MAQEHGIVPSALEQEASVLGTVLAEGTGWYRRVEHLMEGSSSVVDLFYDSNHIMIASAMRRVAELGQPISISTLTDELLNQPDGSADRLTPDVPTYLTHLQSRGYVRDLAELSASVDTLNQKLQLRNQLRAIESIGARITSEQPHPNEISSDLRQVSLSASVSQDTPRFGEIVAKMEADDVMGVAHRLQTNIKGIDDKLRGGLEPGRLFIVAARPKVGKTQLLMNMSLEALAQDYVVVYASLEIGERELWSKLLSAQSRVEQRRIQRYLDGHMKMSDFEDWEREAVETAKDELKGADLYTMFAGDLQHGVDSIIARTMRIAQKNPGRNIVITVDYVQLLATGTYNQAAEIGSISRKLKLFAQEMGIIIVIAAQINREGTEGMPSPSHLKGSGDLEQDADVVMLLNRQYLQDETQPDHIMDIWVALNRYGSTGIVQAYYQPQIQTVTDMDLAFSDDDSSKERNIVVDEDMETRPRRRPESDEDFDEPVRRRPVRDDDDDEDIPPRRRRPVSDDDDEPRRPRPSSRRDDDEDDRPRGSRRRPSSDRVGRPSIDRELGMPAGDDDDDY